MRVSWPDTQGYKKKKKNNYVGEDCLNSPFFCLISVQNVNCTTQKERLYETMSSVSTNASCTT